jgi:hypothetical protein
MPTFRPSAVPGLPPFAGLAMIGQVPQGGDLGLAQGFTSEGRLVGDRTAAEYPVHVAGWRQCGTLCAGGMGDGHE